VAVTKDPRNYQIMVLFSMLLYGLIWLKFELSILVIAAILFVALSSQIIATRLWKLPHFEWRSAMISGLSLSILMRCTSIPLSLLLAAAAIFSKFIFRWNNKHIFNPTNFALALGILLTNQVSVVPSQWGNGALLAFFILCMGIFVSNKACRSDVSFAFLGTFATVLFVQAFLNGTDFSIPFQRLQTGSLLIFTFFMISDPKSTPNSRTGRLIFGVGAALLGIYLQTVHQIAAGLLISLFFISPATPLLDRLFPGVQFDWAKKVGMA
jgi:Na+-transporting NADH:ubiquinone oxidoreductase subunit NqrB